MKEGKIRIYDVPRWWRLIYLAGAVTLIIIINFPAFFGKEKVNYLFVFMSFVLGWTITRETTLHIKTNFFEDKNKNFLSYSNIFAVVFVYAVIFFIVGFDLSIRLSEYSFFVGFFVLSTYFLFYGGLRSIKTKKAWSRWGQTTKNQAVIFGIFYSVLALVILAFMIFVRYWR